jgi:hypothetical protein
MNNLFLNHLKTISPEGRDSETRLFVSKDKIAEATRSKIIKALAGINPNKDYATLKNSEDRYATRMKAREAAMLRRGGTDPESIRDAINDPGGYYANVPAMLGRSRFVGKSIRSREDGKKSPRDPKPVNEDFGRFLDTNKPKRKPKSIFTGKNIVKSAKQIGLIGKKIGKAISTPMSNMDSMIAGRNF